MALRIPYESDSFPSTLGVPVVGELSVTWDDILWAALTVGRPNRHYVFMHGDASFYEAIFRMSMVRTAIEQAGYSAYRLRRTSAFNSLDPTEKGAINYFLGMVFCKLFADKLLGTPWLLHLDVFRSQVRALHRGRSRPDLIGHNTSSGNWYVFESKGRASAPSPSCKSKAKAQAQRLIRVSGQRCALHIGSFAYFKNNVLNFYWCDPPSAEGKSISIDIDDAAWSSYYANALGFYRSKADQDSIVQAPTENISEGVDVELEIHSSIRDEVMSERWGLVRKIVSEKGQEMIAEGYQRDGLKVTAGDSWKNQVIK